MLLHHFAKRLTFIALLLYCTIANGQVCTVHDALTNRPVEGASFVDLTRTTIIKSNSRGELDISSFKSQDSILIYALGYRILRTSYTRIAAQNFSVNLELKDLHLDDVVISANRFEQSSSEVSSIVKVISPKEVLLHNPQTAADLLGISGSVFIQKSQLAGGSPMIRGFATNRLLYAVDGVRMNTAIYRSGNIQNVISLDPFALEKTEILLGAGSVMYGSDAIGGVMNFQTLTPELTLSDEELVSGKAVFRTSSANKERTAHLDINVGWKKWSILTSITSFQFDDLKMGSHGPEEYLKQDYVERINGADVTVSNPDPRVQRPSAYSQINFMQKIRFRVNDKWDMVYGAHYSETSSYSRYDRHLIYKNGNPRYGEWNYGPQKWLMNNLNITHKSESQLFDQLNIRLAQQYFEESRISRNYNSDEREIRLEQVDAYSSNIDFKKQAGKRSTFFYGTEFVLNDIGSSGTNENISTDTRAKGPARYPQSTWTSIAAYLSNSSKLSQKIQLQSGFRFSYYGLQAEFDTSFYPFPFTSANLQSNALTGNLGLVYNAFKKLQISANASSAFRSPNVDDVGKVFDSEPGSVVVPNPNLKAEYSYNADLNFIGTIGDVFKYELSTYASYLNNALVRRNFTLNGLDSILYDGQLSQVQAIQNAAQLFIYGNQFSVELALKNGFGLSSEFNFQLGQEELDNGELSPSRHAGPWTNITRLKLNKGDIQLQLYFIYCAEKSYEQLPDEERGKDYMYAKDENGMPYSPAWYTVNFKSMVQVTKNLGFSAGIENILDLRYRPYSSGIVAPGRNLIFSLIAKF